MNRSSSDQNYPQPPFIKAEVFMPDGLVLGEANLVSDTATITGGVVLPRGTVLGRTRSGAYRAAVASATDGSQHPSAILAVYTDASAGDVESGIYLQGEFDGDALTLDPSIPLPVAQYALRLLLIYVQSAAIPAA